MFTRLIMKADDYGCFHAEPIILRSLLFPLRDVEYFHIDAMLDELERKSLIILYDTDDGKQYLQIVNFGQRLRNMRDNHPKPDDKSRQVAAKRREAPRPAASRRDPPPETKRNESETKQKQKRTPQIESAPDGASVSVWPTFDDFWDAYGKKIDRRKCEVRWHALTQAAREKVMQHLADYIPSTPDVRYRRNPLTYLYNESWNDEIVQTNGKAKRETPDDLAIDFAKRHGTNTDIW